jgi:Sulfocyanin (SoxE) domain
VSPVRQHNVRLLVAGAVTAIVLAAGSTVALAAVGGAFRGPAPAAARCTGPTLAGSLVDVTVTDMGRGMMGGPDGPGPMMSGGRRGMARVLVSLGVVPAGTVSLRVVNQGVRTHELVVLPLSAGQIAGARPVGADGRVDETGSLGEASHSCGAGAGDGIAARATGWVTLTLGPGRYELVCNLPGHYAAGMHAELDVSRV